MPIENIFTPPKPTALEPPKMKIWNMNLLFKGVIFRFQPFVFAGVSGQNGGVLVGKK